MLWCNGVVLKLFQLIHGTLILYHFYIHGHIGVHYKQDNSVVTQWAIMSLLCFSVQYLWKKWWIYIYTEYIIYIRKQVQKSCLSLPLFFLSVFTRMKKLLYQCTNTAHFFPTQHQTRLPDHNFLYISGCKSSLA